MVAVYLLWSFQRTEFGRASRPHSLMSIILHFVRKQTKLFCSDLNHVSHCALFCTAPTVWAWWEG